MARSSKSQNKEKLSRKEKAEMKIESEKMKAQLKADKNTGKSTITDLLTMTLFNSRLLYCQRLVLYVY